MLYSKLVVPVIGNDDADKECESDHRAEEDVHVDVSGGNGPHFRNDHVPEIDPTFEGQDLEGKENS